MSKNCLDISILPVVDNSLEGACEECGFFNWNCIFTDEAIAYLAVEEGESLASAFLKLVAIVTAKSASITALQALVATNVTLSAVQTLVNKTLTAPVITIPSITGLSTYANNAAALVGGLVAGNVYMTSTGVLMIVY